MPENISFRTHLLGSVTDFAEACDMGEIIRPPVLVELIVTLAHYQEEGVRLCPEVYLCADLAAMLQMLPGSAAVQIGQVTPNERSIKEILKKSAPLAVGGWKIYVESSGCFGIFRDSLNPLNVPVEETVLVDVGGAVKVVRLHQVADDCVELRSYCGGFHNVYLSHKRESEPSPGKYIKDLVDIICADVAELERDPVITFLRKELLEGLRDAHGALIAVVRGQALPALFSDGIKLTVPIDFAEVIGRRHHESFSVAELVSFGSLLRGMLHSDGIVVFTRDAKLLAYNCFVKSSSSGGVPIVGGARRRAFSALCDKLNRGTYAVFIQSQDGWSDFKKVTHG